MHGGHAVALIFNDPFGLGEGKGFARVGLGKGNEGIDRYGTGLESTIVRIGTGWDTQNEIVTGILFWFAFVALG